jgi:hypothetical protein
MLILESETSSSSEGVDFQFARLSLRWEAEYLSKESSRQAVVRFMFGLDGSRHCRGDHHGSGVGLGRQVSRLQSQGAGQQGNLCVAQSVSRNDPEELIDLKN